MNLLTYHGLLLCMDEATGKLVQAAISDHRERCSPIDLELRAASEAQASFGAFLKLQGQSLEVELDSGPLAGMAAKLDLGGRTLALGRNGRFLSARPSSGGVGAVADGPVAKEWETFVLLSSQDRDDLAWVLQQEWVVDDGRSVARGNSLGLEAGFHLKLGSFSADLRFQFPLRKRSFPFQITSFRNGWQIAQAFLYRPLVYFTAFRSPEILSQVYLAIQSLLEFGKYRGDILVITDQSADSFLENIPGLDESRLKIMRIGLEDWVGYVAAKYLILDFDGAEQYQPIIFCDPDVIFDSDIEPLGAAVASSRRITAPMEDFSSLRSTPSIGGTLIQRDGQDPRFACGFNAGTLGIPNLLDHSNTLEIIREIIVNHSNVNGREYFDWVDQEIANYVSFKIGDFDTHRITPFVRYGWSGTELDADGRRGLVHFWPPRKSHLKLAAMKTYVEALRQCTRPR